MSLLKSLSKGLASSIQRLPATTTPNMHAALNLHGPMFKKVAPELHRFKSVLGAMKKEDFKVDAVIEDNNALLKLAFETAENDFEPWIAEAREFVSDFDADALDATKMLKYKLDKGEICEGTFWSEFFDAVAPESFGQIKTAAFANEDVLTTHEMVDKFLAQPELEPQIEDVRVKTADSVLLEFKGDLREALADNGLILLSDELRAAMEAQKKELSKGMDQ